MPPDPTFPEQITLERGYLSYQSPFGHAWSVPIAAIALVGSFTALAARPQPLVVIAFRDLSWHAIPTTAPGLPECLDRLGSALGFPLISSLGEAVATDNQVLWPPALAGIPLFTVRGQPPCPGAPPQLLDSIGTELTGQVIAFLSSGPLAMGGVA